MRAPPLVVAVLGVVAASSASTPVDPAPPVAFAPVGLAPVSAPVVASCRSIQARAHRSLLCPSVLPRATVGFPGLPPPGLTVQPTTDSFGGRAVAGVDIGYGAPWEGSGSRTHRWRNRPCCFLHFDVFRRARSKKAIPKGARPARLGGRRGLLAPAHEGGYEGELYFANHVRFLWREHGVDWVATLHTFGEEDTERLLGRLIAGLRPVDDIEAPARRGPSVGRTPNAITEGSGAVWIASLGQWIGEGTVLRFDPAGGRMTGRVGPGGGGGPHALAVTHEALWVVTYKGVVRLDPRTLRRVAFVTTDRFPKGIAAARGRVWVTEGIPFIRKGVLVGIDPRTNRRVGRAIPLGRAPAAVALGAGALWVADELEGTVTRIDPLRGRVVARIRVGHMPTAVAAGQRSVWVANAGDGTVVRIDPRTNQVVATLQIGTAPRALAIGAGAVWVATTGDGSVRRIDPETERVRLVRRGLVDPLALLVLRRTLWVTTNDGELIRIRLG